MKLFSTSPPPFAYGRYLYLLYCRSQSRPKVPSRPHEVRLNLRATLAVASFYAQK